MSISSATNPRRNTASSAMEATGLSVGKSVLNGALGYATSAFAEEVALQLGIQRDHAFIRDELEMMQSFMMAAHDERHDNRVVKTWVKQVREVAYDAEDCLQDLGVRLKKPSWWLFPRTLLERRRVAKQMKELRAKVEDVSQRNVRYRLIKGSSSKATAAATERSAIFGVVDARRAAKQDSQRVDLVQLINNEDEDLKVIAVWGTNDDMGQTSIIRAAYENLDVQSKFPVRAWMRVMHPFNPKGFVQSLVNQFHAAEGVEDLLETEKTDNQVLAQEFNGYVNKKRYLIVLNDLSTIEEWDQIKKWFRNNKKGSRIVVSTLQIEVASLCVGQESQASELKQLSAGQTLYAFYDKGYQNGNNSMKPMSSSDVATTSTNEHTMAPDEIIEDQSKDADQKKGSQNGNNSVKLVPSSNANTMSTNDRIMALGEIAVDQSKDVDENKGSQNGKDLVKLVSSLDAATTSTNDHTMAPGGMTEDQSKDADENKGSQNEKDSVKIISSSDTATTSTNDRTVAPVDITEVQSKDDDEKNAVKKSLTRIRTGVGALEESQLIGREKEIFNIIALILNKDNQQGQVISVWGMGGLGKTTLANGVYQSPMLKDKFEKFAFVTILRPFDPAELFRSLVVRLNEESSKKVQMLDYRGSKKETLAKMRVDELTDELKRILEKKSCLIVLDDLSSTTEWDLIRPTFSSMKETSQILVTTREENIAKHCSGKHGYVHNLKVLEPGYALNLFNQKVFGAATHLVEQNPELAEEAIHILKKCGGLPLAIVVIGGFLANRPKTTAEWRKLNENISAELEMNPELGMIRTVLEKSYDGLPYHLKSCFLYLSIFPEDHIICRRRLVRRWTAEGYSSETRGKSANEIADDYFTDLKNRSMILPSQQSVHSRRSIDSCKVHDLIREIAISKSIEENLVFRLEEGCGLNTHGAIRHLAISSDWKGDQSEFESIVDLSRIRSLSVFGKWRSFFLSDKMRFLRVLDLEGTEGLVDHHLQHIGKLLHLRYLSLRGCDGIFQLPDSLGNLRQLQTLDLRDTSIWALPKTIIKLRKLRYIHAGRKSEYVAEDTSSTTRCRELLKVGPQLCASCCVPILRISDDHNCRDACTLACCVFPAVVMMGLLDGAALSRGTRKLKELHTLSVVNVGRGNSVLQDMERLTGLRKLGVSGIKKKNAPAFRSAISNLSRLESLSIGSARKPGLCGCLDGISSPPENLQSLKLYGNLETLPEWIGKLQHLVKLKLVGTRLSEHDAAMEFLGNLPKLAILGLFEPSFQGEKLHFQSQQTEIAFGSLRVLKLGRLRNIKSVKFEKGAMPKLELLQLTRVRNEIGFSGLEFLPSINEVQLNVYFEIDYQRIHKAHDSETRGKIYEEERQEARRKGGEFSKKVRDQLAGNPKKPNLTVDVW
ncbi:disease resistance protein PIK6-NP-like [Phragmites australis]|uniref:disease resistance protein PIK6-NP-like n=1 Tax=Phragmites australis TaxID=29695 RepID=UPI002D792E36|nr:disease resistance protein PIK6-NP-like [Phragmites australis]XP_062182897.1 disease resistance protein PIK6-NP-like [Phragmites australis]